VIAHSPAKAWSRALELTAPIANNPRRIFSTLIEERANDLGQAPALLSDGGSLSYDGLARRSNQYARWARSQDLDKGDVVGLLMPNQPEYMAIWLGITSVGGVVALLNTNLTGRSLAHCITSVAPKHVIVAAELAYRLTNAVAQLPGSTRIWVHGASDAEHQRIDRDIEKYAGDTLSDAEQRPVSVEDRALYIFTSGTTGLPKAANVSHARLMQWSHWFAGMMGTQSSDRMYNCLPMYHSVGGVLATGAVLVGGGSVVLRDSFSARQFWDDVVRWDCTLFQYIGELCRYLLNTPPSPNEATHRIRMCCGNGLRADIWEDFKRRFRIPQILEFYAATEGNVSIFNVEGRPGALGRVPPFLAHRSPMALVRCDVETGEPVRTEQGFCDRVRANEAGEAIGRLSEDRSNVGGRFDGYTNHEASERKILRNAFEQGDAWFRTGDLMRQDDRGYFYFVDRMGDTFRWKGENVSTLEVSEAICAFPGVRQASVYGVAVPGTDGRAGMAAVAVAELDLVAFRRHLIDSLPSYAHPLFLRIGDEIQLTGTFKYATNELARQGYDPVSTTDTIYFNHSEQGAFVRLDGALYERIQTGQVRW
jgi:fatty-acyl-CoA synthase